MSSLATETRSTTAAASREAGLVLRPIRGEADAPPIPLAVGRYVIGSAPEADVRLEVQGIDSRHAVLLVGPQRSVLKAFSRFTWVNDGVVRECTVKPGDRICLGPVEFEVLKGKTKRRSQPKSPESPKTHASVPSKPERLSLDSLTFLPEQALVSREGEEASKRRRQVIAELNGELLSQLSQIVERETVASDRERRILEQSAQIEGRRRVLDERNTDIERLRAELASSEAEWRRKSTEASEQAMQLRLERESLQRDRARMAEETARMTSQTQAVEQRREALDVREARLEEQRTALELRTSQLNQQEHRHSAAVAQALVSSQTHAEDVQRLGTQKALLQQQSEQLRSDREQLNSERTQYESDRDKLFAERAHLAAREVEVAELRRQVHEQQADLAARESSSQERLETAASHQSASEEMTAQLAHREQSLAEQEAALYAERKALDERKREVDEQHASWMLERHTLAARASVEREPEPVSDAELNMLRSQVSELQSRLREERSLWEQERIELTTPPEPAPELPAVAEVVAEGVDLQAEITELRAQFEAERARHEQERTSWEAEQDLLLRDRQALEAEWRRLESRMEKFNVPESIVTEPEAIAEVAPPPIPSQFLAQPEQPELQTPELTWEEPAQTHAPEATSEYRSEFGAIDGESHDWSEPAWPTSGLAKYADDRTEDAYGAPAGFESAAGFDVEHPSEESSEVQHDDYPAAYGEAAGFASAEGLDAEHPAEESSFAQYGDYQTEDAYGESTGFASAEGAEAEYSSDAAESFESPEGADGSGNVLSLRAQLAEMFGIQSQPGEEEPAADGEYAETYGELPAESGFEGDPQEQMQYGDFEQEAAGPMEAEQSFEEAAAEQTDGFGEPQAAGGEQSDEEIMSAYLARLLKKSPEPQESMTKIIVAAPEPAVSEETAEAPETHEQEPQKQARRLNAEEKETLRANMDSFRELANQQARAAVAKHKSNELKNGVQTISVAAILIAVVGAILISAEFWTSASYRMYGLACLAVSGGLGIYTVINGMRIRKLRAVAKLTDALGGDEPEPTAEKAAE